VDRGGLTHRGHDQGLGRATLLCGRPVAPLHLLFGSLEDLVNFWMSGVGDIPNGYTSDVYLNQQARVAHQGGMADFVPDGPVAGETMAVLDAGAYGGSGDRPMACCLVVHAEDLV
jgi:hypothetical protein